ncbi:YtpI family protein [Fredinandcohnia quinoae]|uniref:YtpI family protein n=1 Tax=Fredinandcohnia quinoae TaxID=2918902 RepID=A0AAW5EEA9_9BACI|nr:YtpI family protein [Fredinandcohnia sp. SECRCQ15]MCH1627821.1 YtpI family protein [Fredinandcohnia sp. SECRCQ15]
MPILVVLIIFSFAFYLYYKTKYFRSNRPVEKQWLSAKSSIALGVFVFLFAINTIFLHPSTVSTIVGIVFLVVGGGSMWAGYRAYKHYLPFVIKEAEQIE